MLTKDYLDHIKTIEKFETEEDLFNFLTKRLYFFNLNNKHKSGQTVGVIPKGDLVCIHAKLGFKCVLPIGRSELQTKDKLISIFHLYLLELLEI